MIVNCVIDGLMKINGSKRFIDWIRMLKREVSESSNDDKTGKKENFTNTQAFYEFIVIKIIAFNLIIFAHCWLCTAFVSVFLIYS